MKYKTLFRLLLKIVGILLFTQGIAYAVSSIGWVLGGGISIAASILSFAGHGLMVVFGLYLFFGGRWIVDKAIPSNRPYCQECGYDLTGTTNARCPECDTPFRAADVRPPSPPGAAS